MKREKIDYFIKYGEEQQRLESQRNSSPAPEESKGQVDADMTKDDVLTGSILDYTKNEVITLRSDVERLRGQLQNCVNLLHRLKQHGYAKDSAAADKAIDSANRALYETLIR